MKQNIQNNISLNGLNIIRQLKIRDFAWKRSPDEICTGLVANEVELIYPNAVSEDTNGLKMLGMGTFILPMIKAVQEVDIKVHANELEIVNLKNRVIQLEDKVAMLKGI